jgi:cyanophycinase
MLRVFVVLVFSTLLCSGELLGQGKLVLVGGGSESVGGWSDAPYQWAVDRSENKRVAVISYADADDFIPNYFISLGAVAADNIKIATRAEADDPQTYDLLMGYDVFFFKGGDQSVYYNEYKGTLTAKAITDKFSAGGVIGGTSAGMAILSGVIYTAENGTVYPDEALRNLNNNKMTLADDFVSIFPGFIFDSHFTERGRVGRLIPFMAHWYHKVGELLYGVGVDDRTALCIDDDRKAVVYGTGSVSFYSSSAFPLSDGELPVADAVSAMQLLHGDIVDLSDWSVISGPASPAGEISDEDGNYQVLLSGAEGYSVNTGFLDYLVKQTGEIDDSIIVVTAPGRAKAYIQRLESSGAKVVVIEASSTSNDESRADLRNAIRVSRKVLFVENNDNGLFSFLQGGMTGALLESHIRRNGVISAFVGENSRYAGKVWVANHLSDGLAAYYGRLQFRDGLSLLKSSVVMSNTYDPSATDFYENTTASVSWAMVAEGLKYGIYLNRGGFLKFAQDDDINYFQSFGDRSSIVLTQRGGNIAVANQPVNTSGAVRNYVGFTDFSYTLLSGSLRIDVGNPVPGLDPPYELEPTVVGVEESSMQSVVSVVPNPSRNGVFYLREGVVDNATIIVTDLFGRRVWEGACHSNEGCVVDLSDYPDGMYLISVGSGIQRETTRVLKQ